MKSKHKRLNNLPKCQETMTIHQETFRLLIPLKCYKLIDIDLSRQRNRSIPPQIHFIGKLKENVCVTMFFIAEK